MSNEMSNSMNGMNGIDVIKRVVLIENALNHEPSEYESKYAEHEYKWILKRILHDYQDYLDYPDVTSYNDIDDVLFGNSEEPLCVNQIKIAVWAKYGIKGYSSFDYYECDVFHDVMGFWPTIDEYHYLAGRVDGSLADITKEDIECLSKEYCGELPRPKQLGEIIKSGVLDDYEIQLCFDSGKSYPLSKYGDNAYDFYVRSITYSEYVVSIEILSK